MAETFTPNISIFANLSQKDIDEATKICSSTTMIPRSVIQAFARKFKIPEAIVSTGQSSHLCNLIRLSLQLREDYYDDIVTNIVKLPSDFIAAEIVPRLITFVHPANLTRVSKLVTALLPKRLTINEAIDCVDFITPCFLTLITSITIGFGWITWSWERDKQIGIGDEIIINSYPIFYGDVNDSVDIEGIEILNKPLIAFNDYLKESLPLITKSDNSYKQKVFAETVLRETNQLINQYLKTYLDNPEAKDDWNGLRILIPLQNIPHLWKYLPKKTTNTARWYTTGILGRI